jgi:hypothetical protein
MYISYRYRYHVEVLFVRSSKTLVLKIQQYKVGSGSKTEVADLDPYTGLSLYQGCECSPVPKPVGSEINCMFGSVNNYRIRI